ncbi:hypothetical protein RJT34_16426 [Clitoria ternatea]|uniref:ATP-grasp domain-containing protein n=1 Tax=Clitoria ternatea TaxID=43366 RepID=A0AAN9J7D7_CLITE
MYKIMVISSPNRILDVVAVKTPKLRGQAWVCYSEVTAASNAVQQMQNFPIYDKPMKRNQKLLEEAPSPVLTPGLWKVIGDVAVVAAASVSYIGVGMNEFPLDERGFFYLMEMNTRIQVEHPVTEMISSTDLIEEQIRIAMGKKLWQQRLLTNSLITMVLGVVSVAIFQSLQVPSFLRRRADPKNVISIILGGGPGIRLFPLTKRAATPALLNSKEKRKILLAMADALENNESMMRLKNGADVADAEEAGYDKSRVVYYQLYDAGVSKG